jgi:monoamine oxidase
VQYDEGISEVEFRVKLFYNCLKDRKELTVDFEWSKIKTEYITSDKSSYRKLAEKYGIPLGSIYKRAKREKWVELRKQSYDKKVVKTVAAVEQKQADRMKRIQTITDKLLDKIERAVEELDIQLYKNVEKVKEIEYNNIERPDKPTKETIREEERYTEIHTIVDRKGAQELASAIKSLKEVQMLKSELDEEEQRARIEKLRKETEDEQKDTSVVVKFEGEIDKWSK